MPIGPDSFDVYDDGSILITDPLLGRLSLFDPEGKFRRSWALGFAADSVKIRSDGTVSVRDARTSDVFTLDQKGELHPSKAAVTDASAKITSSQSGVVTRGGSNVPSTQINVRLDQPGLTLLSLQLLGAGKDGSAFVALESTPGQKVGEGIIVNKSVRRYSSDGRLLSQTDNMPLDYYITPVDELRVHQGVVYQLLTTPSEVRVNIWNMN